MPKEELILQKLSELSGRFDTVDRRLDAMDGRFEAIDGRFDAIDGRFDGVENRLDLLAEHAVRVDDKLARLEHLPGEFAAFKEHVVTVLDRHTGMLSALDGERLAFINRFERIERRVGL